MFEIAYKRLKNNKVLSSGLVYLAFSLGTQLLGLFYTPLLTNTLKVSDYGIYNLVLSLQGIISIVFTLCITSGFSRFYNDIKDKSKFKYSILNFLFLIGIFSTLLIINFSNILSKILLAETANGDNYIIILSLASMITGFISVYEAEYIMEFKSLKASIINFLRIFIRLLFISYIVYSYQELSVFLILKVQLVIEVMIFMTLFLKDIKGYKLQIDIEEIKKPVTFGLGLVLGQVSTWILTLIDRRFLVEYSDFSDVGIYSLAYTIGMLINPVLLIPFKKIFTPFKFKVYDQRGGKEKVIEFFNFYIFSGIFCVLGLSLYSKILVTILGTKEYLEAVKVVPFVSFSYFLWGLNEFFGLGLNIKNKSLLNSLLAGLAAILNIILNLILIPLIGIYGAAIATLISYGLTNILYYKCGKKYYHVNFELSYLIKYFCIYIFLYGLYSILNLNLLTEFIINILFVLSYFLICFKLRLISIDKLKRMRM
ncbi:LPS biosynthesis protein [Propionigenium maris DSM 9537]|uniref:LPS biosynthesis protein n=1 Tax=Propionigenium maris DSM 9537 TaxID=1123000 RepID=A0A9W6GKQ8_9FUSO|nr:oligosaccharide flippase family protein [Propionigenium maris]GLI56919.1 LPS biosynthesis protein [Propionigenium maris DSM 9537]